MLAVGVDMVEVARIDKGIARHGDRFISRFFTPQEQSYCAGRATSLAGRIAIKEAVSKALGTGIGDISWTDVEVVNNERGRPELVLHNNASSLADSLGIRRWAISLSHTETHAIGFAVGSAD